MALKPYKAERRNTYWMAVDTRTGRHVSYPTPNKRQCANEVATLNRAYAEAVAANEPEGVLVRAMSGAGQ